MPNTLNNFMVQQLASGLVVLRNNTGLLNTLRTRFEMSPGGVNSTVDFPFTNPGTVGDVLPAAVPPAAPDTVTGKTQLPVDKFKQRSFNVTDAEMESLNEDYFSLQTKQAVTDLSEFVNGDLWGCYRDVYNSVGVAGTPPFATDIRVATDAARTLSSNKAPEGDRAIVLDTTAYYNAVSLPAFYQNFSSNDGQIMREGQIGRKFGFDWNYDQQARFHQTGTANGLYVTSGATAIGATSVNIAGGTGNYVVGDTFQVAGDITRYVVTSPLAGPGALQFAPGAKTAWATNSSLIKANSHAVSLAFHRDAIAFVMRPLSRASSFHDALGKKVAQLVDPVSGLSLRLIVSSQYNQVNWEYQILYGFKVLRPDLAVRIMG